MRAQSRRAACLLAGALAALAALALPARAPRAAGAPDPVEDLAAGPVEPPADAEDGGDVELEAADSIAAGTMEVGIGAAGQGAAAGLPRRRVRVQDRDLAADAREGPGDPLAGAVVRARALTVGRFARRWGRGLVAGTPDDPWRSPRDGLPLPRGRSLEGASWCAGPDGGLELFGGRMAKRGLGGARLRAGPASAGVLGGTGTPLLGSLGLERESLDGELAMDAAGRWRAEAQVERALGATAARVRVRAGLPRLGAVAEPGRSVPAQAITAAATRYQRGMRASALGAWWRFRPGLDGARAALAVEQELSDHQRLALGFEEQQGRRRDAITAPTAVRQGLWGEWRGGPPGLRLGLRGEAWGEGPWARGQVRRAAFASVECTGPARSTVRIEHGAYRVRPGESLYLAEAGSDRVVLRALTGAGERTFVDWTAPLAEGRARASVTMTAAAGRPPRLQWTVDWSRRLSTRTSGR